MNKLRLVLLFIALAVPCFGQLSAVATVGGEGGYTAPYAEAGLEGKHSFDNFLVFGEARGASGRKSDTHDGWHLETKAGAALKYREYSVGGGMAYSHQWTSLYEKSAMRPFAYAGFEQEDFSLQGFWYFKGNDTRNGVHGLSLRATQMFDRHWGMRLEFQALRAYQTDRPKEKIPVGGAQVGAIYQF
jgi:hypothetical protein